MVVDSERLTQARRNQANIGNAVDRGDPAVARTVIDRLLPDPAVRAEVLSTLVRAIEDAHAAKPQSWSVSLFERGVRFNVGQIFALDIVRDAALVVLDAPTLAAVTLADLGNRVQPFEIKKLPNLCACFVFHDEHSRWSGGLADANRAAIQRAAARAKAASQRWEAHSSGVLEYLREEGRQVPTPEYEIVRLPPVPRETVLAAMRDFLDDRLARGLGEWRPTGQHRYAIEHEGRHYPVKEIVTRVTGQPRAAFAGGPQANNYAKSLGFDVVKPDPSRAERSVWWVNQGDSYEAQRDEGSLWAPLVDAGGQRQRYWETLREVGEDDLFVHFYQGHIRAIGRAAADAEETAGPDGERGRGVEVEYFELPRPVPIEEVRVAVQELAIDEGPLDQSGQVKQAYLCRFSDEGLRVIRQGSGDPWPDWTGVAVPRPSVSPPTAKTSAVEELRARLDARGISFAPELLSTYLLALATKRFVILTGLAGTGKTQLAVTVARLLGGDASPTSAPTDSRSGTVVTVAPYMREYNRFVLPAVVRDELVPSLGDARDVLVRYPQGEAAQPVYRYPGRKTTVISFGGTFRQWFQATLDVGAQVVLDINVDEQGRPALIVRPVETRRSVADNLCIVPVRPDWTDHRGLLGYQNALDGEYVATRALRFLLEARDEELAARHAGRAPRPFFLVLDEMNLAHVEHYFADFLSAMESGEELSLHDGADDDVPARLPIPGNLFVVGTVNMDETTYQFSPKVLDRAFTLGLSEVDLAGYGLSEASPPAGLRLPTAPVLISDRRPGRDDWQVFARLVGGVLRAISSWTFIASWPPADDRSAIGWRTRSRGSSRWQRRAASRTMTSGRRSTSPSPRRCCPSCTGPSTRSRSSSATSARARSIWGCHAWRAS